MTLFQNVVAPIVLNIECVGNFPTPNVRHNGLLIAALSDPDAVFTSAINIRLHESSVAYQRQRRIRGPSERLVIPTRHFRTHSVFERCLPNTRSVREIRNNQQNADTH